MLPNAAKMLLFCLLSAFVSTYTHASSELSTADKLKSCDRKISLATAEEVLADPKTLSEPSMMFPAAFVLFRYGNKDEAVFWFYAAQLRLRYQAAIKGGDYGQVLAIMMATIGPLINTYALQDTARLTQILDRVLEWDKTTANPLKQLATSKEATLRIENVYSGISVLKQKLLDDKESIERSAQLAAADTQLFMKQLDSYCQSASKDSSS